MDHGPADVTGPAEVTEAEVDQHLADIAAGRLDLAPFTVVSAWGRKAP
jgi:hypothetical protein